MEDVGSREQGFYEQTHLSCELHRPQSLTSNSFYSANPSEVKLKFDGFSEIIALYWHKVKCFATVVVLFLDEKQPKKSTGTFQVKDT